mmetsp:Transcript_10274/g.7677  ORF Transcript_10274/g.7677 Transcript_10274/m.7677 type:complete len:120 (+) Transcript_10274:149-508(+)
MAVWLMYGLIPFVDYLLPHDHSNLNQTMYKKFEKDGRFLIPLYLAFIFDVSAHIWMFFKMQDEHIRTNPLVFAMYLINFTIPAQINGVNGHELIHRKEPFHKALGYYAFFKINFAYYPI